MGLQASSERYPRQRHRGWLFVLAAVIGIWLVSTRPPPLISKVAGIWPRLLSRVFHQPTHRTIELDRSKSRELYELLAPRDVRVIVGWDDGRVDVRGSAEEVETLVALAGILSRDRHRADGFNRSMERPHSARDRIGRTYHLPQEKTRMLSQLLRDADLSLDVSTDGHVISIGASPEDHAVMDHLVKILNGERL